MHQFLRYLSTIFFLTTAHGVHVRTADMFMMSSHWDYAQNGGDWEGLCRVGLQQSPIELSEETSIHQTLPAIDFWNYYQSFLNDSTLTNNGHSCSFHFGKTTQFVEPHIGGGNLEDFYIAEQLHFHWGYENQPGSEHVINGRRFDIEMHIVHRNRQYETIEEAAMHPNGLAVLGIMIDIVDENQWDIEGISFTSIDPYSGQVTPGLSELFQLVPQIEEYHSETLVASTVTVGSLLQNLNTHRYYSYHGSLTTPDCHQSVHWIVFANPIQVQSSVAYHLFSLRNSDQTNIVYNYRVTQPTNNRPVMFICNDCY